MTRTFLRLPILLGGLVALGLLSIFAMPAGQAVPGKEEIKDDQKFNDELTGFGLIRPDDKKWMFVAQADFKEDENMVAILRKYDVEDAEQQKTRNPLMEWRVTAYKHGYNLSFTTPDGKKKQIGSGDVGPMANMMSDNLKKEFKELKVFRKPAPTGVPGAKGGKEYTLAGLGTNGANMYFRGVVFAYTANKYTFHVLMIAYEGAEEKDKEGIKYVWDHLHVTKVKPRGK